jgi:alpha-D-xyloside xylohydrolase
MKFNDGYWLLREGVTARYAVEAFDVQTDATSVSVAALSRRLENRGSHLNTPTITVDLSSPALDVVTVRVSHMVQQTPPGVRFVRNGERPEVLVERGADEVTLRSGRVGASIATAGPWTLRFMGDDRELCTAAARSTGSMTVAGDGDYTMQRLTLPVGASVYGLGERFTALVKNGQVVESWNQDGGTASEQAYKAIPFFLTDAGFGVFVDSPGRVSFEVGSEVVSAVQFSVPGDSFEYHVIYGPGPREILEKYTALTGRPALPPQWSFGLWLSTSFTTEYDEQTVSHFVDGMADRDIPLSVFHFDCYWMKPLNWCDFEWDPSVFPDPDGMLSRLSARGLHLSVWINPYIGQRSRLFTEAAEAGFLLRRPDGRIWQWDMWVAGMALVDFTNPAAREWYAGKVRALLEQGVDAIKTDFGERVPTDVVWHDGSDPELMHNYYSYLYNRTVFETVEATRGLGEAVLFARSATAGGQQFPVHWGGDCESTYPSMAESLRAGLSLGMSGFGFWSHDIGGFEGTPSPALFKRWVAFGLLSSHARLHGSDSYRVPWVFDEESVDVTRKFSRLRNTLMPYLWNVAVEAHHVGLPVMRAMVIEFSQDRTCASLDRQYMLGPDLLVAPVFSDEGLVEFYLPQGCWIGYLDGRVRDGGCWIREQHEFDSVPLLVRPGAVIPIGARHDRPDYDYSEAPVFEVFGMLDGASVAVRLTDSAGTESVVVEVRRTAQELRAQVTFGADRLRAGWTLRWVTGPLGEDRGPAVSAPVGVDNLRMELP